MTRTRWIFRKNQGQYEEFPRGVNNKPVIDCVQIYSRRQHNLWRYERYAGVDFLPNMVRRAV